MFGFSMTEWLIFAAIVLLLFGKRIPGAMRSLGLGLREFQRGLAGGGEDELIESR